MLATTLAFNPEPGTVGSTAQALTPVHNSRIRFCSTCCPGIYTYRALPPVAAPGTMSAPRQRRPADPIRANPLVGRLCSHAAQRSPLSDSSRRSFRVAQLRPRRALPKAVARSPSNLVD